MLSYREERVKVNRWSVWNRRYNATCNSEGQLIDFSYTDGMPYGFSAHGLKC